VTLGGLLVGGSVRDDVSRGTSTIHRRARRLGLRDVPRETFVAPPVHSPSDQPKHSRYAARARLRV